MEDYFATAVALVLPGKLDYPQPCSEAEFSLPRTAPAPLEPPLLKPERARKQCPGGWHCLPRRCRGPYAFPGALDESIVVFNYGSLSLSLSLSLSYIRKPPRS